MHPTAGLRAAVLTQAARSATGDIEPASEAQLLNWVETYPDYQKPAERLPSGLVTLNFKSVALGVTQLSLGPGGMKVTMK
jgi:hypothetical protein